MIVFTYPGQGSQKAGMGVPWVDHPSWELISEASKALDRDLEYLLLRADDNELRQTRNAQISTFMVSLVALDALGRVGIEAAAHAGHSLGEYSALTASGALDFADAVRLVGERGDAMQVAAEEREGTMAAVLGLDDGLVESACARVNDDVWVANFNAPGQVVIAGRPEAIEEAGRVAKDLGAKRVLALPVSGAFHTPFMGPARDRLRKAIDQVEFRAPDHRVYANVDALAHTDGDDWAALLNAQLCSPIRWRQTLHNLADSGITTFFEVGPGKVLTGMAKRTNRGCRTIGISTPADIDSALEILAGPPAAEVGLLEGESLHATERLVVSPRMGVFETTEEHPVGSVIKAGDLLGSVGDTEVRSPFAGELKGYLAVSGERVTSSQPIAWLMSS